MREKENGSYKTSYSLSNPIMSLTLHSFSQRKSHKASPHSQGGEIRFHLCLGRQEHHSAKECTYSDGRDL